MYSYDFSAANRAGFVKVATIIFSRMTVRYRAGTRVKATSQLFDTELYSLNVYTNFSSTPIGS